MSHNEKGEWAVALAELGFHVIPLLKGKKLPAFHEEWQKKATNDAAEIAKWWRRKPENNVGIATGKPLNGGYLIIIDIDDKVGKRGKDTFRALEGELGELPATLTVATPSGGTHLYFWYSTLLKTSASSRLGLGVDTRGAGGYVVAPGSFIGEATYTMGELTEVAELPEAWALKIGAGKLKRESAKGVAADNAKIDTARNVKWAKEYLATEAAIACEGAGGDATTFRVAARVKDFGISKDKCFDLMDKWNDRCSPPWPPAELEDKIANAYEYGEKLVGEDSPEAQFEAIGKRYDDGSDMFDDEAAASGDELMLTPPPVGPDDEHPLEYFNKHFAFVRIGGTHAIIFEMRDKQKRIEDVAFMNEQSFHRMMASMTWQVDGKTAKMSKSWMDWVDRRSYLKIAFAPETKVSAKTYNLWRGFTVAPSPVVEMQSSAHGSSNLPVPRSCALWFEHIWNNVCQRDEALYYWVISWFAHCVQKPWEKPLVALVLRGGKGTGKNSAVAPLLELLGDSGMVAANRRYLTGNFNSHLENKLLMVLDEAFWSGDKGAEGTLKDLVTGAYHNIERKGFEPFRVANLTRVVILGNESWLVPASTDERRYCVLDMAEHNKQDTAFFTALHDQLTDNKKAGLSEWLDWMKRWLPHRDGVKININVAPITQGLLDQKEESLEVVESWVNESLKSGTPQNCDGEFGDQISSYQVAQAINIYARDRNIKSRLPSLEDIGRKLKKIFPTMGTCRLRTNSGRVRHYTLPKLRLARSNWGDYLGHLVKWGEDGSDLLE